MEEKLDKAVEILIDQVRTNLKPAEALQQTQAVLNIAHARKLLVEGKSLKKQVTGS